MNMNRREFVKGLAAMCVAGAIAAHADAAKYVAIGNVAKDVPKNSLAVMTYNIRTSLLDKETDNRWEARRDALAELVERENPDAIGFQEVMPDQSEWLQKRLPQYAFVGEHRNADRKSGEASPVAYRKSRFAVKNSGTFWLSETPDVPASKSWKTALPRICSYAVLEDSVTGRTFAFANTHTDHRSELAREKGMLLIIERMKDFGNGAPIVLTGDHNCFEYEAPAQAVSKILTEAMHLSETPPEGSWRTFNYWTWRDREISIVEALKRDVRVRSNPSDKAAEKRIDYIYVSPGTRVLAYRTIPATRPGTHLYPSDHFPTVATIQFK